MVVCRYFLEGRCRFGNNCYNDHILPETNSYNSQSRRYDSPQRRYDSPQRDDRYRYESPQYRYESPQYRNQREQNPPQYGSSNYRYSNSNSRNNNYSSGSYSPDYHAGTSNPYQWQASKDFGGRNNSHTTNSFQTSNNQFDDQCNLIDFSLPGQARRSRKQQFENSHSQRMTGALNSYKDEKQGDASKIPVLKMVKEDMIIWELGQQWPFSCYSPEKDDNIPYFEDISPEELRYRAYEAEKINSFTIYVEKYKIFLEQVNKKRELLKNPNPGIISVITRTTDNLKQEPQLSSKDFSFNKALGNTPSGSRVFFQSSVSNIPANIEMDEDAHKSLVSASPSSFKFVLPSGHVSKSHESISDTNLYTPVDSLTREERDEFLSATFTLGRIPTRPPPKAMCL